MAHLSGGGGDGMSPHLTQVTLQNEANNPIKRPEISSGSNIVENDSSQVPNNCKDFTFDNVIGHLEDMLIDEEFQKLQNSFLEKYWREFEDSEENKLSYMAIFNEYTNKIEDFITEYLKKRIYNFDLNTFASELEEKKSELEGEIFEVLFTLSDFTAFKEIFMDYRQMKEGRTTDLGKSLFISSVSL